MPLSERAYGRGTAVEGGVTAIHGGLSIDLGRMNSILAVHTADLDARVEAGVTQRQLNAALEDSGLFFSVDPGAEASLGGMAATRASGTNTVRYGTMRDNTLALTVVLADGRVIRTARRARKSSAGYDLTRLFVGTEGTLGIITEVTVRLFRRPPAICAAVCAFDAVEDAVETVIRTVQGAIPIARAELLDEVAIGAVNAYSGLEHRPAPTLFLEFHGTETGVAEQAAAVEAIAAACRGNGFRWTADESERRRLWQARHDAYYAMLALRPGARGLTTDVCVPVSRLAECIVETKRDLDACPLPSPLLGHVGDGNFHVIILIDPASPSELAEAERVNRRLVERALAMDGTCTGEHGVGVGKIAYMAAEHGEALEVMRQLKRALDPQGLLNPGKVLGDP
jgi:D-lactate dehydrogenase (cytochrome)